MSIVLSERGYLVPYILSLHVFIHGLGYDSKYADFLFSGAEKEAISPKMFISKLPVFVELNKSSIHKTGTIIK